MNHEDWVRQELRKLSRSLGFRYTPLDEIKGRLNRVKTRMEKQGIEALLVAQKMDFYYLSGTTQDGLLFLPLEGNPLLMIKREFERAKVESPLEDVVPLKSLRHIPSLIQTYDHRLPRGLGLEFDVLPVNDYPPTQKATVFETMDECVEGTLESSYERKLGMLRRVPPNEVCGEATGFGPWGLHSISRLAVF